MDKEYQLQRAGILLQEKLSNSYCTVSLDFNKYVYFLIHEEPREFTNTSKNGKAYKVKAWKIHDKWISVFQDFTFKCSWGKWLIVLDPKFNQKTIHVLIDCIKSTYNLYEVKHVQYDKDVEIEYHGSLKIKAQETAVSNPEIQPQTQTQTQPQTQTQTQPQTQTQKIKYFDPAKDDYNSLKENFKK